MNMDKTLWSVLLKLVNNKIPTPPQEWGGTGEVIYAIEQMVGFETSKAQGYFNALDPETQSAVLGILTTVRLEHDYLNHQIKGLSLPLEARSDLEKQNIRGFVEQKIRLLNPLLNLSKAIQPTSIPERLQIIRLVAEHCFGKNQNDLGLALSQYVRSMTGR